MEALDEFDAILEAVPTHHQALANRARSLRGIYPWVEGHKAILAAALADIEQAVELARNEPVFQAKYQGLRDELKRHAGQSNCRRPPSRLPKPTGWTVVWVGGGVFALIPVIKEQLYVVEKDQFGTFLT